MKQKGGDKMDVFGIFQGGGAKGLAHVGALKAVEPRVNFIGVAGSSAGAIVAAFVAVGYKADELYCPHKSGGLFDADYPSVFFGRGHWDNWRDLASDVESVTKLLVKVPFLAGLLVGPFIAIYLYLKHWHVINDIINYNGALSTDTLEGWINSALLRKLKESGAIADDVDKVLFRHVTVPLKIVASNITTQGLQVYSKLDTPGMCVASAVARSAAIPVFFKPAEDGDGLIVDGGLLSNFPAWIFDAERRKSKDGPLTPTLGFRLIAEIADARHELKRGWQFFLRLFNVAVSGDATLEVREVDSLHIIPLKVKVGTTSFDLNQDQKRELYRSGYEEADQYVDSVYGPKDPDEMDEALEYAIQQLLDILGRRRDTPMRANIALETIRKTLRITYSCRMDKDADDRLEFEKGSGACGLCWDKSELICCDLEVAAQTYVEAWKMTKYQQALVSKKAISLLCVPMYDPIAASDAGRDPKLIGVLNFDSSEDLLDDFGNEQLFDEFRELGKFMAGMMQKRAQ